METGKVYDVTQPLDGMTRKASGEGEPLPCKHSIGKVPRLWRSFSTRNPIPASRPGRPFGPQGAKCSNLTRKFVARPQ
jgi:hypothetical protein